MPRPLPALLTILLLLTGCAPHDLVNIPVNAIGSTRILNQPYGPLPRQKLDVYTPTNALPTCRPHSPHATRARRPSTPNDPPDPPNNPPLRPLVIFFYGGYWQSGDRQDYAFAAYTFENAGYVAAVPDYRLFPHARFPAFLDDAARAVAYLHTHAADYGADPNQLILIGHSAGAYIATMLNVDPTYLQKYHVPRSSIRAVITLAAPFYFTPITHAPMTDIFSPNPTLWPPTQPATFITAPDPLRAPMLLIQGAQDHLIPPTEPARFAALLKSRQTPATPLLYPHLTHTGVLAALVWPLSLTTNLRPQILHFIAQHTNSNH